MGQNEILKQKKRRTRDKERQKGKTDQIADEVPGDN